MTTQHTTSTFLLVAIVLALLAIPTGSNAQTHNDATDAMLREGIALRQAGRDLDALPHFESAYAGAPGPITAAQLGLVEQALGRWTAAEPHLREALEAVADPWVVRHRLLLERAYAANQQRVGQLEILGAASGAEVLLNGAPAGRMPFARPLSVPAGPATLEVRASGYLPVTRQINIRGGTLNRESIELSPLPIPPETAPPLASSAPPSEASAGPQTVPSRALAPVVIPVAGSTASRTDRAEAWRAPVGWVGVSLGLALGAGGTAAAWVREDAALRFDTPGQCPQNGWMTITSCQELYATGQLATGLAVASFVVGGLAIIGGTALLIWPHRGPPHANEHASFTCAPTLGERGVACRGVF